MNTGRQSPASLGSPIRASEASISPLQNLWMGHELTPDLETFRHFVVSFCGYPHLIRQREEKSISNGEKLYTIKD